LTLPTAMVIVRRVFVFFGGMDARTPVQLRYSTKELENVFFRV